MATPAQGKPKMNLYQTQPKKVYSMLSEEKQGPFRGNCVIMSSREQLVKNLNRYNKPIKVKSRYFINEKRVPFQ